MCTCFQLLDTAVQQLKEKLSIIKQCRSQLGVFGYLEILTAVQRRLGEYWRSRDARSMVSGGIRLWKTWRRLYCFYVVFWNILSHCTIRIVTWIIKIPYAKDELWFVGIWSLCSLDSCIWSLLELEYQEPKPTHHIYQEQSIFLYTKQKMKPK